MGFGIAVLLLVTTSLVRLFLYIRSKSFASRLPVVEPCHPVIGNAMLVVGMSSEQLFNNISRALANPAKLFRVMATVMPVVVTNDPDMTQRILTSPDCLEKAFLYKFFRLDSGLFAANYDLWKAQRKAINPTFNLKILHKFIPLFDKYAQELVQTLGAFADGRALNLSPFMHRCSMKTICATTMGVVIDEDSDADRFAELLQKTFHLAFKRLFHVHWHVDWMYRLTKDYKKDEKIREEIYKYGDEIMRKAAERHSRRMNLFKREDDDCCKLQIFMDQMLNTNSGKKFSDIEINHNFYTMIVGGSDTTGIFLGYIAIALAANQDIQEKVYQEICTVYPRNKEVIFTPESLNQLLYTDMFLKECLRLFPVVPMVVRKTLRDVDLNGFRVPKGNILIVSIYNQGHLGTECRPL